MANILPSRTKYKKISKGRIRGVAKGGNFIAFGDYALQVIDPKGVGRGRGRMTASQIEAARVAINRYLKRKGKVWMRVFPHRPVTKKPAETRMGKGKGSVEYWAAVIKPGCILFEVSGVPQNLAREAMRLASDKLPFRCRFVSREELEQY